MVYEKKKTLPKYQEIDDQFQIQYLNMVVNKKKAL